MSQFEATREANYRAASADGRLAGVTIVPSRAKCRACGKLRTVVTGSYSKSGKFTCGQCRPVFARIAGK